MAVGRKKGPHPWTRGSTAQAKAGGDLGYESVLLGSHFLTSEIRGWDGTDWSSMPFDDSYMLTIPYLEPSSVPKSVVLKWGSQCHPGEIW